MSLGNTIMQGPAFPVLQVHTHLVLVCNLLQPVLTVMLAHIHLAVGWQILALVLAVLQVHIPQVLE